MDSKLGYRAELDGLRAVAVGVVILFHAGFSAFAGGYIGVDIFFVISGYLITSLLLQDLDNNRFSLWRFYERRARRILPALAVVMAVSSVFAWQLMLPQQLSEFGRSLMAVSLFFSNISFYFESGYFSQASELKPLLHTWSLAVEEQFYIVFPLALYVGFALSRRWQVIGIIAVALVALLAADQLAAHRPRLAFYSAPTRAWELLAGVLCAYVLRYAPPRPRQGLSLLGLVVLLICIASFDRTRPLLMAMAVAAVMLIILFAGRGTLAGKILGHRWLVGLGLISYSTYLWHQPLFAFARIRFPYALNTQVYVLLALAAIGLGYLSWRYVEQPFRRRRGGAFRIPARDLWVAAAVSFGGLILSGVAVQQGRIAPQHFTALRGEVADIARLKREVSAFVGDDLCDIYPANRWQDWACDPFRHDGPVPGLMPLGVAVIGDSYAGDLAASLRSVGFTPFQGSVPGCNIEPGTMTEPCREFFDRLKQQIDQQPRVREIWIDASYLPRELTDDALARMVDYWQIGDRKLFFKTAAPMYPGLDNARLMALLHGTPPVPPVSWREAEATSAPRVVGRLTAAGVGIIDGAAIFCAMHDACGPRLEDGRYLMRDKNHLSIVGLQLFGKGLLEAMACGVSPELTHTAGAAVDCRG